MSVNLSEHPFLQPEPPARYERNFLRQVVCELRFPTLFELNSSTPNLAFANGLRKVYPNHSHQITDMEVNGDAIDRTHTHVFKSKNLDWSVTLRPSAISLETSSYTCFADLVARIQFIVGVAKEVIDSDFFTRIGLRYINIVPMNLVGGNTKEFDGWIRSSLVDVLVHEDLGVMHEYSSRMAGRSTFGTYILQHGVGYNPTSKAPEYYLDFDFARENVELEDVDDTLTALHTNQFAMFRWSLGPRGKEYLGPSIKAEN